jgi:uncharacterized repeat protein (TIGR01451 family)
MRRTAVLLSVLLTLTLGIVALAGVHSQLATAQVGQIHRVYLPYIKHNQPADPPQIAVDPESYDFGQVELDTTVSATFTISNTGDAALTVSALSFGEFADPAFEIQSDFDLPLTLEPLALDSFDVLFSPTSAGEHAASLSVFSDDPARPSVDVRLIGVGLPGEEEKIDSPDLRHEFFRTSRAFPEDMIPDGAKVRAWEQLQTLRGGGPPVPARILGVTQPITETFRWASIGPENVGTIGAGRVSAVAVDSAGVVYAGAALGGAYKSSDGGTTWQSLMFHQPSLAVGSIAIDPGDNNTVYVGTGEANFSDSYYGAGVLKTTDSGALGDASWQNLGRAQFVFSPGGGATIGRMIVDPTNTNQVYAATNQGFFRSTDGGGVWNEVLNGLPGTTVSDIVMDPTTTPVTLYAGVPNSGIYRSVDAGLNWNLAATGLPAAGSLGRIAMAIAPSNTQIIYAGIQNSAGSNLLGVYRTDNGGTQWGQVTGMPNYCNFCWYANVLEVHPTNPNLLLAGGLNLWRGTVTLNMGTYSWTNNPGQIPGLHPDQHAIAFDPSDNTVVYVGNDGGLYRSTDTGNNFTRLSIGAITQHQGVALHPAQPNFSSSGSQDNGNMLYTGDVINWTDVGPVCDGGWTAMSQSPVPPHEVYITTQSNACARILRADSVADALADNFNQITTGINIPAMSSADGTALFYAPLVIDPSNATTLYYGSNFVYRTTNRGNNWSYFPPTMQSLNGSVSTITPAPSNATTIYAGTNNGRIWRTTTTPANWVEVRDWSGPCGVAQTCLPQRYVTRLAVHPTNANTIYATFSGWDTATPTRPGHVFRSPDGGQTWFDITPRDSLNNRIDLPVNVIVVDPNTPNNLYIGTDIGVLFSANNGATWQFLDAGLPDVAIFDMAFNPSTSTVRAASHGRGMFDLVRAGPQVQVSKQLTAPAGGVAGVGDSVTYTITISNTGTTAITNLPLDDIFDGRYLRFVSASLPPTVVAPNLIEWDDLTAAPPDGIGQSLRPNQTLDVTVTFEVIGCPTPATTINKARVSGAIDENRDPVPTVSASAGLTIACPEVQVSKVMDPMECWVVGVGDALSFTVAITNTGNTTIDVLPLADTYDPNYLHYTGATPASDDNIDDGAIDWTDLTVPLGDLAPGDGVQVSVGFEAVASTQLAHPPETVDRVRVAGATDIYGFTADTVTDRAGVEIADADLFVTKDGPAEAMAGGEITYTITFGNLGPDDAAHVRLRDMLPADTTYVSDTLGGANFPMAGVVDWYLGTVPGGYNNSFELTVQVGGAVIPGTDLIDQIAIESGFTIGGETCPTPDSDETNNQASVTSTVLADFGDADDPPYTTRLPMGAYHGDFTREWLGANVDGEPDAKFPDNFDDGTAVEPLQPPTRGKLHFWINTSGLGTARYDADHKLYLRGWVDFDEDHVFDDPEERILDWSGGPGLVGTDGTFWPVTSADRRVTLHFNIPPAPAGFTWVRFRLSYDAPVGPTGGTPYGEVEDHQVRVGEIDP